MVGNLMSQLETKPSYRSRNNPCQLWKFELPLAAQCSGINNWKHTYVGWMV